MVTEKQRRLLKVIEQFEGKGKMEIYLAFELDAKDDSTAEAAYAWRLTRLVVHSMVARLIKRGLVVESDSGWKLTEEGRKQLTDVRKMQ